MSDYAEFRIRIVRGTTPRTYRVEASGLGGEQEGRFKVPFPKMELENFILRVGGTRRGVRRINSPEFDLARTFGQRLFTAIMADKVGHLYRSALSEARAERKGLRITLSLGDVPELAAIPWEYLYDDPDFLAISPWTPVVRYLDLPKPRRALETELPLNILAVVSSPTDVEPLDAADERRKLEAALQPLLDSKAVTIDWLDKPSLLALARKLRPDTYHILHFIGHGGFDDSSQEGALLFEDDAGKGRLVSGDQLGAIIRDKLNLRLVVLNSCEGARSGSKDPFSGVATSLVEREIPAVIGMQFEITDRAARLFAGEFYTMLAEGQPVDAALAEARLAIFADQNDVEWGTPVLFMRVTDGRLFEVAHAAPLPRAALPPPPPVAADVRAAAGVGAAAPAMDAVAEDGARGIVTEPSLSGTASTDTAASLPVAEPVAEPGSEPAGEAATSAPDIAPGPADVAAASVAAAAAAAAFGGAAAPEAAVEAPSIFRPARPISVTPDATTPPEPGIVPFSTATPSARPIDDRLVTEPIAVPIPAPEPRVDEELPVEETATERAADASGATATTVPKRSRRGLVVGILVGAAAIWGILTVIGLVLQAQTVATIHVSNGGSAGPGLVAVTGSGFEPNETIRFSIGGRSAGTALADGSGNLATQVAVPVDSAGTVEAVGTQSGRSSTGAFDVRPGAPTETPVEPSNGGGTAQPPVTPKPSTTTKVGAIIPDPNSILFYSTYSDEPAQANETDNELYSIDPATRQITQLTSNHLDDTFPSWSTQHDQIAFARKDSAGRHIFIRGADGKDRRLTDGTTDYFPVWSVTNWIAYVRLDGDAASSIRIIHPDGTDDHPLYSAAYVRAPAWARDGGSVLFMISSDGKSYDLVRLYLNDPTKLFTVRATPFSELNVSMSPNQTFVAFIMETHAGGRSDRDAYIQAVNTDATQLTDVGRTDGVQDGNPTWSRDGSQIAFYRAYRGGYHLWLMNLDGSHQEDLMPNRPGDNLDPSWW